MALYSYALLLSSVSVVSPVCLKVHRSGARSTAGFSPGGGELTDPLLLLLSHNGSIGFTHRYMQRWSELANEP